MQIVEVYETSDAESWPVGEPSPPTSASEAQIGSDGPWSAAARGVEIRQCLHDPQKGLGAFAVRRIPANAVIGVYMGEHLTLREFNLRHGWTESNGGAVDDATPAEEEWCRARSLRLAALEWGAPIDGEKNGGSYCFSVLQTDLPEGAQIAYIDGEDPNYSGWTRYINHAAAGSDECNATSHANAEEKRVWFTATRDILPGEENHFDYQEVEFCGLELASNDQPEHTAALVNDTAGAALLLWQNLMPIARTKASGFGVTKLVADRRTGGMHQLSLACLSKHAIAYECAVDTVLREVEVLQSVQHCNIVSLVGVYQDEHSLYLLMQPALVGGSLRDVIDGNFGRLTEESVRFVAMQATAALRHLHERAIVCRGVCPESLHLDRPTGSLVLADMSLARRLDGSERAYSLVGSSAAYVAPETLAREGTSTEADWWALGAICFEALVGQPP